MPSASKVKGVPRANRTRSTAQKRIDLSTLVENSDDNDPTLDAILTGIGPYLPDVIKTLGEAAASGDTQAAKTVLEFLGKALANRGDRHSQEILKNIASVRKGGLAAALAEEDSVLEDS